PARQVVLDPVLVAVVSVHAHRETEEAFVERAGARDVRDRIHGERDLSYAKRLGPAPRGGDTLCEQCVQRGVALVHPLLHAGLEHAVPLRWRAEEREEDEPRAAVPEVLERRGLDDDVSWHPVPLARLHDALRRDDLAIAALEAV